ncbi:uncharacterized protein [Macrobrachium rosenbergii]|uniref:uncharacterized protein isoform X2 n=1 Tax=Macrobrachium rosenbergii TaxID=79674 RepID=UPI0034D3BD7B
MFTYVSGPEGQTVVIVPARGETTEEEVDTCICHVCISISIILSSICLLLGIIYGSIMLSLGKLSYNHDLFSSLTSATFWLLGIGVAYVSGPEGQTVVIVRPRRVTTQKEADTCICHVCITISILLSTICLLLGIIYGSMILSLGKLSYKNDSWLITATFWFLGIGGFFVLTSLCIGKYIQNIKAERRRRFMYTAGDSEFQTPYLMQDITQDQSSLGGQGELHSQGYDALPEEYASIKVLIPQPCAIKFPPKDMILLCIALNKEVLPVPGIKPSLTSLEGHIQG